MLKVLYLVFNEGYSGEVDLAVEAIRLTRLLAASSEEQEAAGLLALMLLHHARREARWDGPVLVSLHEQDRSRWDTALIASGLAVLQAALAMDQFGEYQAQAAIAALHCDAASADETDWVQVVRVVRRAAPAHRESRGRPQPGGRGGRGRRTPGRTPLARVGARVAASHSAANAWLHERADDLANARTLYTATAAQAVSEAERHHLTRQAARLRQA